MAQQAIARIQVHTVKHGISTELRCTEHPYFPVLESLPHVLLAKLLCARGVTICTPMTDYHQFLLIFIEEIRRFRIVGHEEEDRDSEHYRGDALNDHNPLYLCSAPMLREYKDFLVKLTLQPLIPWIPSMCPMPNASSPPRAPAMAAETNK